MNLPTAQISFNNSLEDFNYRHIAIDGILSNIELYVFAGQRGYYVLSPMLLADGHYMLVNKGIVSKKRTEEVKITKVTANGILYCDGNKNWFIKNDIDANTWFTLSAEEISNELGIELNKCILWQEGFDTIKPMKHLEYAITWFALSLIWLVMYVKMLFKNRSAEN